MKNILIIIFIGLLLCGCSGKAFEIDMKNLRGEELTAEDKEWLRKRREFEKYRDEMQAIREREERFGHKEIVELCMDWDDAWNDRSFRMMIIEELKARGQDPMLCRSTSNSSDEVKRATAIAIEAARRARAAEDRAYDAEQEAYENRRRQDDYEYNQQNQQQQQNQDLYQPQPSTCVYPEC